MVVYDETQFATRCIHAGEAPDPTTGAHGVPLYQNVTFAFETQSGKSKTCGPGNDRISPHRPS